MLTALWTSFTSGYRTQVLSGIGGAGKTELALQYAWAHTRDYTLVWWVDASDPATLAAAYAALAVALQLRECTVREQSVVVNAVQDWLQQREDWLLILDNASAPGAVAPYLLRSPIGPTGHVLLTSRNPHWREVGVSVREVPLLEPEAASTFLQRRTGDPTVEAATALAQELDYLPQALALAASYIETAECGIIDYLDHFRTHRARLLTLRTPMEPHPDDELAHLIPIVTSFTLAFSKVEAIDPDAAELLRYCAFLHPTAIPEVLLTASAQYLSPRLQALATDHWRLNKAVRHNSTYGLLRRDPQSHILSLSRLHQAILQEAMDAQTQRQWAARAVRAVNHLFPDVRAVTFKEWPRCDQLLPHVLGCADHIRQWELQDDAARRLLNETGIYLHHRARYAEAEPLWQRCQTILAQIRTPGHPDHARIRGNLATLYHAQGRYIDAEQYYRQAATMWQAIFSPDHPTVAQLLNNLAVLYYAQGRYADAEPLCKRALAIRKQARKPDPLAIAQSQHNLADLYCAQGHYADAERLYRTAQKIRQEHLEAEHPDTATSWHGLADLYCAQGRYADAEPLYQCALDIRLRTFGPHHPDTATTQKKRHALAREEPSTGAAFPAGPDPPTARSAGPNPGGVLYEPMRRPSLTNNEDSGPRA